MSRRRPTQARATFAALVGEHGAAIPALRRGEFLYAAGWWDEAQRELRIAVDTLELRRAARQVGLGAAPRGPRARPGVAGDLEAAQARGPDARPGRCGATRTRWRCCARACAACAGRWASRTGWPLDGRGGRQLPRALAPAGLSQRRSSARPRRSRSTRPNCGR